MKNLDERKTCRVYFLQPDGTLGCHTFELTTRQAHAYQDDPKYYVIARADWDRPTLEQDVTKALQAKQSQH